LWIKLFSWIQREELSIVVSLNNKQCIIYMFLCLCSFRIVLYVIYITYYTVEICFIMFSSFSWTFLLLLYIIIVKKYKTAVSFAISKHWIIVNVKCFKLQLTQYYNMHPVLCTIITLILYKNTLRIIINNKSIDMIAPSSLDGNSLAYENCFSSHEDEVWRF